MQQLNIEMSYETQPTKYVLLSDFTPTILFLEVMLALASLLCLQAFLYEHTTVGQILSELKTSPAMTVALHLERNL